MAVAAFHEKIQACWDFMDKLREKLGDEYEEIWSGRIPDIPEHIGWSSRYLVPAGTQSLVTYYTKPAFSLRFSTHWNWYASTAKCSNDTYCQCLSADCPAPRKREEPGMATTPRTAIQVCIFTPPENKYYCIYGERFDRRDHKWYWIENDPEEVAAALLSCSQGGKACRS